MIHLLPILLIPLLTLGALLPNRHSGNAMGEFGETSSRPHIHLSTDHVHGLADHGRTTTDGASGGTIGLDHDADAIYFLVADTPFVRTSLIQLSVLLIVISTAAITYRAVRPSLRPRKSEPARQRSCLPIYLLIASLRL